MTDTQGGRGKFILMDYPVRTGMFKFNTAFDWDNKLMVFAAMDDGSVDWTTNDSVEPADAAFQVASGQHTDEWICLEYFHDINTGRTGYYLWTQDGSFSGEQVNVATSHTVAGEGFSFSYWNNYCDGADADSYLLFDELAVSESFKGPPAGFLDGSGAITVDEVSQENISHGQQLIIKGSGFGTKDQATPLRWETFEDGVLGEQISTTGFWEQEIGIPTRPAYKLYIR